MNPTVFCTCALKCFEELSKFSSDPGEHFFLLKMLAYATTFEAEDDDELTGIAIRGFKTMTHAQNEFIVRLRNSVPFNRLDLKQEKFVYTTLRKILNFEFQ